MFKNFFQKLLYGGGILFDLFEWVIFAVVILIVVNKFVITIFIVDGLSMFPTLKDKEIVLLNKAVYASGTPNRGDIVAVKYPGDPDHKRYVKRVIGLPGDNITISGGSVLINGVLLKETYLEYGVVTEPDMIRTLKDNEYFLMGDNRPGSNDCRVFGPVEKRFISGKAIAVLYPRSIDLTKR